MVFTDPHMHLQLPNRASTTYKINIERKFTMYRTKDLVVSYSHNIIIALVHGKADQRPTVVE